MPGSEPCDAVVSVAGDWAPIRRFTPIIEQHPDSIYGDLLPVIQSSDLSIVNLEAPLSDRGVPKVKSGSVFKGEKKHVKGLTAASFDVATLANNHMFDYGIDAFQDTLDILDVHHIRHTGAGMSEKEAQEPLVAEVNNVRIGVVNFSEGEDLTSADNGPGVMGWHLDTVVQNIKKLKKENAFIIVISHCGIEYVPFPPPYVVHAFQRMADAGADLVIGHHPHVPQGVFFHNNVPVCCSLGNFVFFQETDLKYRKLGYLVKAGIKGQTLVSLELVPYRIHDQGVSLLKNRDQELFYKKLEAVSTPLNDPAQFEDTWNGFLHHWGMSGFKNEVRMIMEKIDADPAKGSAMFRNRLTTLQHFHHWKDFLTRVADGRLSDSPQWARDITEEWLTAKVQV